MSTPNVFARRALKRFEKALETRAFELAKDPRSAASDLASEDYKKAKRHLMNFLPAPGEVAISQDKLKTVLTSRYISVKSGEKIIVVENPFYESGPRPRIADPSGQ